MKDKELKLNASGYYDEPCYKAITASPKPGEIWLHGTSGHFLLVIANQNGVCSTLRLIDQEKEGSIMVTGTVPMYARPIMLGYCFEQVLQSYVKTVKGEEFKKMKRGIAFALGLQDSKTDVKEAEIATADMLEEHTTCEKLEAEYAELLDENKALEEKLKAEQGERRVLIKEAEEKTDMLCSMGQTLSDRDKKITQLNEQLEEAIRTAARAEIYKEMYMTLLDKVIAARGCVNE